MAGTPIPIAWVEERLTELRRGRLGRQLPPEGGETERLRRWVVQELVGRMVELHEARTAGLVVGPGSEARRRTRSLRARCSPQTSLSACSIA